MLAIRTRIALFCAFIALAPPAVIGQNLDPDVIQVLDYSNLPPNQRNRDVAVEKILTILPEVKDPSILQSLSLRVARLYGQSFDHETEKPDHRAAKKFYEKALRLNGNYSLDLISARMELADLLSLGNDHAKLYDLYKEVIFVDPQKVVDAELSSEQLKRMAELEPREMAAGIKENSIYHREIVEKRIQQAARGILGRYNSYRRVAIANLIHHVYVDRGLEAMKNLADKYKGDEEFMEILNRKLAAASVQQWDQRLQK